VRVNYIRLLVFPYYLEYIVKKIAVKTVEVIEYKKVRGY
jgi:hypothetical protein